jgi:hypothetical protein
LPKDVWPPDPCIELPARAELPPAPLPVRLPLLSVLEHALSAVMQVAAQATAETQAQLRAMEVLRSGMLERKGNRFLARMAADPVTIEGPSEHAPLGLGSACVLQLGRGSSKAVPGCAKLREPPATFAW